MGKTRKTQTGQNGISKVTVHRLERDFPDADPKLLGLMRLLVSENEAIRENIQMLRKELQAAHELADQDPLCPVLNRRAFMRELEREIARTERHGQALALLFIDLDDFKAINDTLGHEAGDRTLIRMADTLIQVVRKTDIVSRIGGDEFAIVLIETSLEQTKRCAKSLKARIARGNIGVTASIGVSNWHKGQTADELMAQADQEMFAQKTRAKRKLQAKSKP